MQGEDIRGIGEARRSVDSVTLKEHLKTQWKSE